MDTHSITQILKQIFKYRKRRSLYLAAFLIISFVTVGSFSSNYLVSVPVQSGSFSEGLVGYPRFVNPVLAQSQTDRDMTQLLFSGLLSRKVTGGYKNSLASNYTTNDEFTEHKVTLDTNSKFHDGSPVTVEDILFTYSLIQDPLIKSPYFARLNNVNISQEGENTIVFTTETSSENFAENLTIGILSQDEWSNISREEFPFAEKNISPIGTGPYFIDSVSRDREQRISSYVLSAYRDNKIEPFIEAIEIKFFPDQQSALSAFESGLIDNMANISAQELLLLDKTLDQKNILTSPLSRVFSLFFNEKTNPIFEDRDVRTAINNAIDPSDIIGRIFFSRAQVANGPLPKISDYYTAESRDEITAAEINKQLDDAGWTLQENNIRSKDEVELSFTIHTPDVAELVKTSELIKEQLSAINVAVEIIAVDENEIINSVIRRRDFETLLFGQIINDPQQLHAFWHSSGIEDPGVNIAGYNNKTVDAILERLISDSSDTSKVQQDYKNLQQEITDDIPAVFMFSPDFIYAIDKSIQNTAFDDLEFATDRFRYIENWYIDTELLLPYFIN